MRVNDAPNVGTHLVDGEMHGHLRRALPFAANLVALEITNDQIGGLHHTLADACGRGKNAVVIQTGGDVAVVRGHPTFFEHHPPHLDDVLPKLFLGAHGALLIVAAIRAR
jgi:hypothetical protein